MTGQPSHVLRNAFLDARERQLVARLAQLRQVSLGETLIFANEVRRKRYVLDQPPLNQLCQGQRLVTGQRPAALTLAAANSLKVWARPLPTL
jgi:hypothetical protein